VSADSAALTVTGSIVVTTPPDRDTAGAWRVGDTDKTVTWTAQGKLGLVKIELDPDGVGVAPFVEITDPIARPTSSLGVNNWAVTGWTPGGVVTDLKTTTAILKVTQIAGSTVTGESSATGFAIYPVISNVTITPGAGEPSIIWRATAINQTVTWTEGSSELDFVDIVYSDDGNPPFIITLANGNAVASGPATGDVSSVKSATTLTAPTEMGINAIIRVRDDDAGWAPYVQDDSASFKVLSQLSFNAFPGNNVDIGDAAQAINWNKAGTVSGADYSVEITIDYNDNLFQADSNTVVLNPSILAALQTWTWDDGLPAGINDNVTETAHLRIRDTVASRQDNPAIYGPFSIAGDFINVALTDTDPDTSAGTFIAGQSSTLTWTKVGAAIGNVVVDYTLDNGTNWKNIIDDSVATAGGLQVTTNGTYGWTPPVTAFSNNLALIRISDPDNYVNARGQTAAPFTLTTKTVLTDPDASDGFDIWLAGTTENITWNSFGTFSTVSILYSSDGTFGAPLDLTATDAGTVSTEYAGATTANDGTYAWVIQNSTPLGPTAKIRIVDADRTFGLSVDSDDFRTKGNITISAPDGTAELTAGVAASVNWQRLGTIASVNVYYSDNDGTTYYTSCVSPGSPGNAIACNWSAWAGDNGTLSWQPPQTIYSKLSEVAGQGYLITIEDFNDNTVAGITPEFTVEGQLAVTAPTGAPTWKIGDTQTITWNLTQGNIQNVKIIGSLSGSFNMTLATDAIGADTFTIIASTDADNVSAFNAGGVPPHGQGSYPWVIADSYTIGSILSASLPGTMKIRVLDVASCAPPAAELCFDTSVESAAFSIIGQINVTTPPAAGLPGVWRVGDTNRFVNWTAQGQLGEVMIELDPDGAGIAPYVEITDPLSRPDASAGNWPVSSWNPGSAVADYKTSAALLRVTRTGGGAGTQVSHTSGAFAIYPGITNVTVIPATLDIGSDPVIWRAGVQSPAISVEWTEASTNVSAVDIYLSTTGVGGLPGTLVDIAYDSSVNGVNSSANTPAKGAAVCPRAFT